MDYSDEQTFEAGKRIGDALVELGLGYSSAFNSKTLKGSVSLTARGLEFRHNLIKVYEKLAKDKGKPGLSDFVTSLQFLIAQSEK